MPIHLRLCLFATSPTVPAPKKGSSIVPSIGHPAKTHGSIRSFGKVAKWLPLNGFVVTVQTERLFLKSRGPIVERLALVLRAIEPSALVLLCGFLFPGPSGYNDGS